LYKQIGWLKMELEWMKKELRPSAELNRPMIGVDHPELSIRQQCQLLGLNRSSLYYEPAGETPDDLRPMRLIDG
jgi:putative transposase